MLLQIMEMQIKSMVRYYKAIRMAKIENTDKTKCWRGGSNWNFHTLLMGMQNSTATLEKQFGSFL
jgi:hypothetical protein